MKHIHWIGWAGAVLALVLPVAAGAAASGDAQGPVLFDGKTLAGWTNPPDGGRAWVREGELCLQADQASLFLSEGTYADFIFEGQVKLPAGASGAGLAVRWQQGSNGSSGYPVEVNQATFEPTEWNQYRIHCVGPSLRAYVNGTLVADRIDATHRQGRIGLRYGGHAGQIYRFRDLRLRELAAPAALTGERNGLPLVFFEDFESGAGRWDQTDPNAWKIIDANDNHIYSQFQASAYEPPAWSPYNIAWTKDLSVGDFVLQASLEQTGREYGHRDMCIFFGYRDPAHYYYAHIATAADDAAHSIHIVNGGPRTSIIRERTAGVDWSTGSHDVRIVRDTSSGSIDVFFDDMDTPVLRAVDKTFDAGRIGFGTFDDTGNVDDVMVWGITAQPGN